MRLAFARRIEQDRPMEWNWRRIFKWLGIVWGVAVAGWLIHAFAASEETQMLRVQAKFIQALENRRWSTVDAMISKDYADEWGQGADEVKGTMRELLKGFFVLSLDSQLANARTATGLGYVKAKIKVEGSGAGVSSMVMSTANGLKQPWVFHWHKRGRWPWSWELVQIHNDGLDHGRIPDSR